MPRSRFIISNVRVRTTTQPDEHAIQDRQDPLPPLN